MLIGLVLFKGKEMRQEMERIYMYKSVVAAKLSGLMILQHHIFAFKYLTKCGDLDQKFFPDALHRVL